ncbi:hypothetical protein OIU79_016600 [Salix purpurea]|uniref:Uncharacterized protein n=1 Tax=Salix purpurea TaxID=77065 RepID=A0A9Q0PF32_SALPP|nr:hypothetical protein OIU79_016600 [Salix purpurea]
MKHVHLILISQDDTDENTS